MADHKNEDPIGQIGAVGGHKKPHASHAHHAHHSHAAQHKQLEGRLRHVRPTDLTRAHEKSMEPELADKLDIPFEHEPLDTGSSSAGDSQDFGSGAGHAQGTDDLRDLEHGRPRGAAEHGAGGQQPAASSSEHAHALGPADASEATPATPAHAEAEATAQGHPSTSGSPRQAPAAGAAQAGAAGGSAPASTVSPASGAEAPQVPDMAAEIEQVRRSFEPTLSGTATSVMGGNAAGLLTPNAGLPRGMGVDGARAFTDGAAPRDTWHAPGMGSGWGMAGAAMMGLTALSAFTPFMFGMPFMCDPFGFGMMGGLGMSPTFIPMMSMLSTNLMMAQNMALTPPLMGCMPWATASAPYPFPFTNPYTAPPGMGMPGYGTPGMGMPGYGTPGMGMPGYGAPGPVVARVGTEGPVQSTLQPGAPVELSEVRQQKLAGLAPDRRQAFESLFNHFQGVDVTVPGRADKVSVNEALGRLLESGKLDVKDKNGNDLLHNLTAMASQPAAAGLDARLATAQTVMHLADPAATMTQGSKGTCAAATVEYMLARRNPAEYARVAAGLMSPQGAVDLASGKPINRVADSVPEDGSGRTSVQRVMQAAFMNAEAGGQAGQYSNVTDTFQSPQSPGWNPFRFFGKTPEQGGLTPEQVQDLATQATGEKYVEIFREGHDPFQALPLIQRAAQTPGSDGVPVSMQWDGGRHRVLVTDIRGDRVYFRNPWGERTSGNVNERLMGSDHQIHDGGVESVPIHDFAARMKSAIVPQQMAG